MGKVAGLDHRAHLRSEAELRRGVERIRRIEAALARGDLDPEDPEAWLQEHGIPVNEQWRNSVRLAHERHLADPRRGGPVP